MNNHQSGFVQNPRSAPRVIYSSAEICRYLEVLVPVEVLPCGASSCGRLVQALSASLSFTIGGILRIDGVVFGLTTQHTLRDLAESLRNKGQEAMGLGARGGIEHVADPMEQSSTRQQPNVNPGTAVTERKRRVIMPSIEGRQDDTRSLLDWALIAFDDEESRDLGNTLSVPSGSHNVSISSIVPTNEFEDSEVLITAGKSGLASGWLRSSPISMQSQNGVVEARQIILDRPLGRITQDILEITRLTFLVPGDSGSWVLKDDKLYGHIFAKRTLSPIAYMLPIESIFEDIRWCLKANSITLVGSGENWWE